MSLDRVNRILGAKVGDSIVLTKTIPSSPYLTVGKKYPIIKFEHSNDTTIGFIIVDNDKDEITIWYGREGNTSCAHTNDNYDIVFKNEFQYNFESNILYLVLGIFFAELNILFCGLSETPQVIFMFASTWVLYLLTSIKISKK